MGACWAKCQELDADEVFAYNTVKLVRVKDRYLGILRLLMLLGIFLYIFVFVLIVQQKYLELEDPVGTCNTSLMFQGPVNVSSFPYCTQYTGPHPAVFRHPCVVWDDSQVKYPADQLNSLFITTRVSISTQVYQCGAGGPQSPDNCTTPWKGPPKNQLTYYFTSGVEAMTINMQHSMQARDLYLATHSTRYTGANSDMAGKLVDGNDKVLQEFGLGRDIITVGTFLNAAGITLETLSIAVGHDANETLRSSGLVMLVFIYYSNLDDLSGRPTYTYSATVIPGAEYKITQADAINSTARTTTDRHGIKMVFLITGTLGRFNFQVALVQLVSALGLLSVATLITELLMLYVLPHRRFYTQYKFEDTVDFSDVRDAEAEGGATDEQFAQQMHTKLAAMRQSLIPASPGDGKL